MLVDVRFTKWRYFGHLCISVSTYIPYIYLQPITSLSFAGKSECLIAISQGSKPQLSVCSMSKLSVSWSYKLQVEGKIIYLYICSLSHYYALYLLDIGAFCADLACAVDSSMFAVLVVLPKSCTGLGSNEWTSQERDGVIILFSVTEPVPVATWSVRKVLIFSFSHEKNTDDRSLI